MKEFEQILYHYELKGELKYLSLYHVSEQKKLFFFTELEHYSLSPLWANEQAQLYLFDQRVLKNFTLFWYQEHYSHFSLLKADSINQFAKELKNNLFEAKVTGHRPKKYYFFDLALHRRTELIKESLGKKNLCEINRIDFYRELALGAHSNSPGAFELQTLFVISSQLILMTKGETPVPKGIYEFEENKSEPPSRAYLKLWEVFSRFNIKLKDGASVLDLGASPGGWTWALQKLKYKVIAFDRSPLAAHIASLEGVYCALGDAFKAKQHFLIENKSSGASFKNEKKEIPTHVIENIQLVVSDVAAYPERMEELMEQWKDYPMIFTIKISGTCPHELMEKYRQKKNAKLIHLYQNKHELTWTCLPQLM